jgi:tRNA(fMet)-specific endonuclease VapC
MVVLDTDVLIGILRKNNDAGAFMESLDKKGIRANTTVINAFELFEGALISSSKEKEKEVENLLRSFGSYNFNGPSSWIAAEISSNLRKRGETIDFQDIAIASISIANNEILVTRNTKHFSRVRGLKIEKW